jgi:hypothetical protein
MVIILADMKMISEYVESEAMLQLLPKNLKETFKLSLPLRP